MCAYIASSHSRSTVCVETQMLKHGHVTASQIPIGQRVSDPHCRGTGENKTRSSAPRSLSRFRKHSRWSHAATLVICFASRQQHGTGESRIVGKTERRRRKNASCNVPHLVHRVFPTSRADQSTVSRLLALPQQHGTMDEASQETRLESSKVPKASPTHLACRLPPRLTDIASRNTLIDLERKTGNSAKTGIP